MVVKMIEVDKIPDVAPLSKNIPINEAVNIWGVLDNERIDLLYVAMKQIKANFVEVASGGSVYVKKRIYETDPDTPIVTPTSTLTVEEYDLDRNLRVVWNGLELVPNIEYTKTSSNTITFAFPVNPEDYVIIDEYPETYEITVLLLSRRDTRFGIQRDFATYPFNTTRELHVLWNGVRLVRDQDYEILSSSSIRFLFDVEIEDTVWVYVENVY
jgi:hypothetical protein